MNLNYRQDMVIIRRYINGYKVVQHYSIFCTQNRKKLIINKGKIVEIFCNQEQI
jgi:hypothetical protein